jgi:hypothetical protein
MLEEREAKPPRLLLRARRPAVKLLSCCAASKSDLHAYTFRSQPGSWRCYYQVATPARSEAGWAAHLLASAASILLSMLASLVHA